MAKMNWNRVRTETAIKRYGSEDIGKPSPKARIDPDGLCHECGRPMERRRHPKGWKPSPAKAFYFSWWDYCKPCRRIQTYEIAKRFHNESLPKPVIVETVTEVHDYTGPAPWE